MSDDFLREKILSEIEQIEDHLAAFEELLASVQHRQPDRVETAALGTVLLGFHTGLGNIFSTVAKEVDGLPPAGAHWHRDLLDAMASRTAQREAIISGTTHKALTRYRSFRHMFVHGYSAALEWPRMRELVDDLAGTWARAKAEILALVSSLG